MKNLKARMVDALRSVDVWVHAALLLAVQYTDEIMRAATDYLPSFAPYLPANIYQAVGIAVVAFNLFRATQRARQSDQAKAPENG